MRWKLYEHKKHSENEKKIVQRKGLPTVIEKLKLSEIYSGKKNLFSGS